MSPEPSPDSRREEAADEIAREIAEDPGVQAARNYASMEKWAARTVKAAAELARLRAIEQAARKILDALDRGTFSSDLDMTWATIYEATDALRRALSTESETRCR